MVQLPGLPVPSVPALYPLPPSSRRLPCLLYYPLVRHCVHVYEIVRGSTTEKGPENAIGGSRRDIQRAIFVKSTGIIRPASEPSCVMQVGVVNYRYDGGGLTLLAPKWNFIVGAFGKCRLRQPYGARFAVAWNWPRRTPIFRSSHNVGVEFASQPHAAAALPSPLQPPLPWRRI